MAEHFRANPIPHFLESFAAQPGQRLRETVNGRTRDIYPHRALRLKSVFDHLESALKREGLHLELSLAKRRLPAFAPLTDEEIAGLQAAFAEAYTSPPPSPTAE